MMVKTSLTTKRLFAPPVLLRAVAIIFCVAGANGVGQTTLSQAVPAAPPPELIEIRSAWNNEVLLYFGSLLTVVWGTAHLFPTKSVVSGSGEITSDNRRIITMEWVAEGVALIFIGALVCTVTLIGSGSAVANAVYIVSSIALAALAMVSLFTGYKVNFLPFKLCPFILGASAVLILAGAFI